MTSPQLKTKKNFEIRKPIGNGGFGQVFKIVVHEDKKVYALKYVNLNKENNLDALADAKMEYDLLRKGIPNVLKSYGSHHKPNKKFIFSTELMEMTLQKYIEVNGQIDFGNFFPIFKNILNGRFFFLFFLFCSLIKMNSFRTLGPFQHSQHYS